MAQSHELSITLTDMKLSEIQHALMTIHEEANGHIFLDALHNLEWTTLAMAGEAGELANKVKKIRRDGIDLLTTTAHVSEHLAELRVETANTLVYLIVAATLLGMSLADLLDLAVTGAEEFGAARGVDLAGIASRGGALFKYVVPFQTQHLPLPPVTEEEEDPSV